MKDQRDIIFLITFISFCHLYISVINLLNFPQVDFQITLDRFNVGSMSSNMAVSSLLSVKNEI